MPPLTIILLAFAGLWTGMYWLFEPTQKPPVVAPPPALFDYAKERGWLFECLRQHGDVVSVKEITNECFTLGIENLSLNRHLKQKGHSYDYEARFYMTPTTSDEVKRLLSPWSSWCPTQDLLAALEADELAESRRRKLRLLAA